MLEINGTIPKNIKVQTWFSFLIKHGVKPYITCLTKNINDVKGLIFDQHKHNSKIDRSKSEYYFSKTNKIYSESLAEFVFNCNYISDNKVINRLENIFDIIFIDEVQDISGYDLEIIRLLFNSSINVYLVGDLRQRIYQTNNALKKFY
ncbi:UvrD-helicase domain-containing protein [Brachyspira hampsonii]|uniref:UvrD-helicase domain-containing protein n=1 Tax=Brachyspira hampsonii TaxID=1287055 RepID=UPI001008387E